MPRKKENYQFKTITNLHFFDIKAQKKTIPYKNFFQIPLTFEEKLQQKFKACRVKTLPIIQTQENQNFRKSHDVGRISKLSKPKFHQSKNSLSRKNRMTEVESIMKSCGKMIQTGGRLIKKVKKLQKKSKECLTCISNKVDFIVNEGAQSLGYK